MLEPKYKQLVPFSIIDCQDCEIFVMNPLNYCNIDNCFNSFIYIAPTESSIYLRGCKGLTIAASCNQIRMFECEDIHLNLHSTTGPTIESCKNIVFSKFQYDYPMLIGDFIDRSAHDS